MQRGATSAPSLIDECQRSLELIARSRKLAALQAGRQAGRHKWSALAVGPCSTRLEACAASPRLPGACCSMPSKSLTHSLTPTRRAAANDLLVIVSC